MFAKLCILILIIYSQQQIYVKYNGNNICNNKTNYEYLTLNYPCLNTGSTSIGTNCSSTKIYTTTYKSVGCSGDFSFSSENNVPACTMVTGPSVCEDKISSSGALIAGYNDNLCTDQSTQFYIIPLNQCKGSSTLYSMYSCNQNVLNRKYYNNSNCLGNPIDNSNISSSTCQTIIGFGYNKLVTCSGSYSYDKLNNNTTNPRTSTVISNSNTNKWFIYLFVIITILIQ